VYPYLLGGLVIDWPNQVWCADITYIPMAKGFVYLVAVMDWLSRRVLAWRLSIGMETAFCVEALQEALDRYGQPDIFNTDQGVQFTSAAFLAELEEKGVRISMDGTGRFLDNIFIERLWRSLKYEDIFTKAYNLVAEVRSGIGAWFAFYNDRRLHQALGYRTPREIFEAAPARGYVDNASTLTTSPQAPQQQQKDSVDEKDMLSSFAAPLERAGVCNRRDALLAFPDSCPMHGAHLKALIVHIVISKFCDSLPLYRQSEMLAG
jgi:putative transposase